MVRKIIGRILLFGAGAAMIVFAVLAIKDAVGILNTVTGQDALWKRIASIVSIVGSVINILVGLTAVFGAIRGKRSLKLAFFAIIMLIVPAFVLIGGILNGTMTNSDQWWKFAVDFALPILYFIGFLIM